MQFGRSYVLDTWESTSKDDRGVVHVEPAGHKQHGRPVMVERGR